MTPVSNLKEKEDKNGDKVEEQCDKGNRSKKQNPEV